MWEFVYAVDLQTSILVVYGSDEEEEVAGEVDALSVMAT